MNKIKILKKECERLLEHLEKMESSEKSDKKWQIGELTKRMGGVFYGMILFMNDEKIEDKKIEKAAKTADKIWRKNEDSDNK